MQEDILTLKKPTSGFGTPLLDVIGDCVKVSPETRQARDGNSFVSIVFDLSNIEVIETTEPYPLPIAQISISHSEKEGTRWAAFYDSAVKILGEGGHLSAIVGKRIHLKQAPCKLRMGLTDAEGNPIMEEAKGGGQRQKWGSVETVSWQLLAVEGLTSAAGPANEATGLEAMELMAQLADGKTEAQFNAAALSHPDIRKVPQLVTQITERKALSSLEAIGLVERTPEGVWKSLVATKV